MKRRYLSDQAACPSIFAFLLLFGYGSVFANQDVGLEGCWRSQQLEVTRSDKRVVQMNGDCVLKITATQTHSMCETSAGRKEFLSAYEITEPGQLRVTLLDQATGRPNATPTTMRYRIEDEWLLFDRQEFPPQASPPTRLRSVSVRVPMAADARCEPRGETGMRVGRTPWSSLSISPPPGWQPLLVDPSTDERLGPAVNANLLIGAFTLIDAAEDRPDTKLMVLLLDDTRPGPFPVRKEQFVSVKRQFSKELKKNQITCNQPDRICASLQQPNGSIAYTELVNIKGRVAIVTGTFADEVPNAIVLLEKSVQAFVAKLREDNLN